MALKVIQHVDSSFAPADDASDDQLVEQATLVAKAIKEDSRPSKLRERILGSASKPAGDSFAERLSQHIDSYYTKD